MADGCEGRGEWTDGEGGDDWRTGGGVVGGKWMAGGCDPVCEYERGRGDS